MNYMRNSTCKISISLISLILLLFSCDDITQENLEGVAVALISPGNNYVSPSGNIDFIWDDTEGAEQYRLQIAEPNFDSLLVLELDTIVLSNEFSFQLLPGNYQWRVRAENNFSIGEYSSRFISVDSALLLTGTNVILTSPSSNAFLSNEQVFFNWNELLNAEQYKFTISTLSGDLVNELILQESNHAEILDEGEFEWSVQGINSNSVSNNTTRTLTIDRTEPSSPMLSFPGNSAQLPADTTFQFTWISGSDLNPVFDSIFIFNENTNPFSVIFSGQADSGLDWQSSNLGIGQFSWEVVSYDAAGNRSDFSNLNFFEVLP